MISRFEATRSVGVVCVHVLNRLRGNLTTAQVVETRVLSEFVYFRRSGRENRRQGHCDSGRGCKEGTWEEGRRVSFPLWTFRGLLKGS